MVDLMRGTLWIWGGFGSLNLPYSAMYAAAVRRTVGLSELARILKFPKLVCHQTSKTSKQIFFKTLRNFFLGGVLDLDQRNTHRYTLDNTHYKYFLPS